ncbi:MAG: type VI secretion system tip protein TssI/VgrG [Kiloniellales bacterium]|nr:type VI secretion system tip protein TssI/VgrG [Kiloniellales bacterium]
MTPRQEYRGASVSSPLGDDVLLFWRMDAREEMSRLFEFRLDLLSENHDLRIEDLLGQSMTVRFVLPEGDTRHFNGVVAQFHYVGTQHRFARYEVVLRPWLWMLTRTADCRIFQHKTVPVILKEIFEDYGFTDFEERYSASYEPRDYCVQYRESDFDFCSRLMEHEGIFYYFKHENGKHTLVLGDDSTQTNETIQNYDEIPYYPPTQGAHRERDHVQHVALGRQVQPGRFTLRDFDFTKPRANLEARRSDPRDHQQSDFEVYDYPGCYLEADRGGTIVGLRLEELQTAYGELTGQGDVGGLGPGAVFSLTNCTRDEQNAEYLAVRTDLHLEIDGYESGEAAGGGLHCACRFTAIDSRQPFRPARITPRPFVQGPQTATVVGPEGEEIYTDEYGRVKCQFHWDREGEYNQDSSCWIRVSSPWAGKGWGGISIPRIGQEVIVDFLEGNPDAPIITGRFYNADNMPPYGLPDQASVSGMKTNSTKGGGGYNEYVMDDTKDNELVREHAQFDKDSTVENDDRQTVNNNRTINVNGTHTETVVGDTSVTVSEGNYSRTVSTGTATIAVTGAVQETFSDTQTTDVTGLIAITSAEAHIHVTAATEIKLEVGSSKLLMKADGSIELSGVSLAINGSTSVSIAGASITSEATSDHNTKGGIVVSEGTTSNTVKGGMVMLNP